MTPERLDVHLVAAGSARSRTLAQRWIREGRVRVADQVVRRPSYPVPDGARVEVEGDEDEPVGRGALKLGAALQRWQGRGLRVAGRRCLDVGASTGGFTQVLLQHGATHVTALDVGHGQLAPELAADPRVRDLPGTNIRDVTPSDLGDPVGLAVVDVSFISLTLVLAPLAALLAPEGDVVLLVKPQFEVGRDALGRGGIVRDPRAREQALLRVAEQACQVGLRPVAAMTSPVTGTHGNIEHLLWLRPGAPGIMDDTDREHIRAPAGTAGTEEGQ